MKGFIKFIICAAIIVGIIINELWLHSGILQYILFGSTSILAMVGVYVMVDWLYDKKDE